MSTQAEKAKAVIVTAPKPEDRVLDLNTTIFGTTGETEDLLLLTEDEQLRASKVAADAVKTEWELPKDEFDIVKAVRDILEKSTGKEVLFYAVRGMHGCVTHTVGRLQEAKMLEEAYTDLRNL
jgi:hypothetical protein